MPREKETPRLIQETLTHESPTRIVIDVLSDGSLNIRWEEKEGFLDGQNFIPKEGTAKNYLALNVAYDLEPLGVLARAAHDKRLRDREQRGDLRAAIP